MAKKETKTEEVKNPGMIYSSAIHLRALMGRFRIDTYDDMKAIEVKVAQLNEVINEFIEQHGGNEEKAQLIHNNESKTLTKKDFAYLTVEEFKAVILQRGFELQQVQLMEYWLVK